MASRSSETTPLLGPGSAVEARDAHSAAPPQVLHEPSGTASITARISSILGPANRILLAGFLMSFTLGITQVPILYVFRMMECDRFYTHNPPYDGPWEDRCHRREINAGTAQQVSILGMSTSFSGVFNLFVCGYFIKLWGPRWAYVSQTSLLGFRVSTQILAVTIGGRTGEIVFQACQAIGIIGGPRGYQLVLNTSVAEVVAARDRTAVFGRLQGAIMLGTAFGFLLGGVLGDLYGIRRPFEVAFFLYVISTIYGAIFMPTEIAKSKKNGTTAPKKVGIAAFFAPLRVIVPHKYRLASGKVITNYGLIFLATGLFLGVFASGYCPTLLQLYATASFNWSTTENGYLMFGNALVRGMFLIVIFPRVISGGRIWFNGGGPPDASIAGNGATISSSATTIVAANDDDDVEERASIKAGKDTLPTDPMDFPAAEGLEVPQEPLLSPQASHQQTYGAANQPTDDSATKQDDEEDWGIEFDLFFVRWSLVIDSLVTFFAGFSSQGWHVYLAGFVLPFASGSAPAAKGLLSELCPPEQRGDALSGITLVESMATLLTQGLFGVIFAAMSEIDQPRLTFFCNAGFAVLGFIVLFMARLPPAGSKRIDDHNDDNSTDPLLSSAAAASSAATNGGQR
ncbi:major facilitator superfamily domain-containing protein [Microdochium trichocladiopsis]|uniref:Major facilitator superfamily domain-containing protein n=1 Tax=Microdochium trichocladiopsis TaxID=1682393 RepID=A0A9P8Y6U8_9PEZI|nr:major facilitator superfamily domain-containing protein [Microdochium trichocladiopsis]KAH7030788.1 major facilitator superfamily domain-containing protein [Microdochium trichocladiopsis]